MRRAWRHPCALTTHLHAVPTLSSGTHAWMPKLNSKVWEMAHSQQHGPKNFPSMLQLLGPLELAAAELSAQNPFPSHERDLRNTILRFAVDTYSMTVTQALLLSTELLLTIKGSQRDSKVPCSQRSLTRNGCVLPEVTGKGSSSDKQGQDETAACICGYFLVSLAYQTLLVKTTTALWFVAFSLPKPLEIIGVFFHLKKLCLKITSRFLSSI